jgi:hypothetical protein
MKTSTSLIVRDLEEPPIHVLEIDGPRKGFDHMMATSPGWYCGRGKRGKIREHAQRSPKPISEWEIDEKSMGRAIRLLDSLVPANGRTKRAVAEIRRRILCVHPMALDF